MKEITISQNNQVKTIDNITILTNADLFNHMKNIAGVMANSGEMVPQHYRGKPDACMATIMQAARWGMDPFAVAQKTHIVSGTLGYEAQLVNAVVNNMAPTKDRIHYDWFGPWENVIGKFVEKTSQKGNKYIAPGWTLADEKGVGVRVWATLKGEDKPRELELYLTQAQVRNSTLWGSDPRQQLAYLGVKRWARLYCPDVILGVYSDDELSPREERDITPAAERVTISQLTSRTPAAAAGSAAPVAGGQPPANKPAEPEKSAEPDIARQLRDDIDRAGTAERATELRGIIEEKKSLLGITLFTELKNKAVKRYHQVKAMADIEAGFENLSPDLDDAQEAFNRLFTLIAKSKRVLESVEYDRYSLALEDMRPEFFNGQ